MSRGDVNSSGSINYKCLGARMQHFSKKNKYGAKKKKIDGIIFDSMLEADYYELLKHQQRLGAIELIELQPKVYLTKSKILMKVDFLIKKVDTQELEYHEVKGLELPVYKLKARLWKHYGKGILKVIKKSGGGFRLDKTIITEGYNERRREREGAKDTCTRTSSPSKD